MMGGAAKKVQRLPTISVVCVGGNLAQNWFEDIAYRFLLQPSGQVNYDLVLLASIPGSFRTRNRYYKLQQAIIEWINRHGSRSGISEDVFFVSVPGVPVRLRVDTVALPHFFHLRFRAISR